jgi:short-subunit dehydrogenase
MALNPKITDWRGKRVWLVGASSGIGASLARALAGRGARLALSARNAAALDARAAEIKGALVEPLDVTDPEAFAPALARILAAWGGVDVVVLNAGTYEPLRAWELTPERARRVMEVNLMGVIHGVAAVVPQLLAQGAGAIVIVGSVAGYRGLPKSLVYGASKSAIINFTESLWTDLSPRGVGVFLVSPGFVATGLTAQNDFKMPALISAEEAAGYIVKGLARGVFEIHFPKRFSRFLKVLEMLPYGLYFRLVRRLTGD